MDYTSKQKSQWDEAVEILSKQLPFPVYNAWIRTLKLYAVVQNTIVLEAVDKFAMDNLTSRYMTSFYSAIYAAFKDHYEVVLSLREDIDKQVELLSKTMLDKRYTFDNFVVGASNSFAYSAALSVAENPSGNYNPLYIYGGVGLGKTHLLNAIGNYITTCMPDKNVILTTSESFTNEFIATFAKKSGTGSLREKFRRADVLIVDDIQFLGKTVSMQEEFFHTFNELHAHGKQVILSSDRPPKEIPTIEERLRSRFEWGLIIDIRMPDPETREAILRLKCEDEELYVDDEVLRYIAGKVTTNIRELEGAFNRVRAQSELTGEPITLEFATRSLEAIMPAKSVRKVTPLSILDAVAERYSVTRDDIISKKRNREFTLPRQIAMYLMREMTPLSTTAIGKEIGDRDHTTVMHGCEKISKDLSNDATFRRNVEDLRKEIS